MKKKILLLFVLIFSISFSNWLKIELVDDFGDKTGEIAMYKETDIFQGMRLLKDGDTVVLDVMMGPQCEVGELYPIKAKIDGGEVMELLAMAVSDRLLRLDVTEDFFEKLKKGTKVAFVVYNTNGGSINLRSSLIGFTKAYNQVKKSKNIIE